MCHAGPRDDSAARAERRSCPRRPIRAAPVPFQVVKRPRGVARRRGEVITRAGASTRGSVDSSTRRLGVQSRPRRVTSRRLSVPIRRLWVDRRPLRVPSLKQAVLRRALFLLGVDGEVIASPLGVQSVPIGVAIVAAMTPCGGEMTSPGRLMTPCGRLMTPRGRLVTPRGRLVTSPRRLVTPPRRLVTRTAEAMTPRCPLGALRGREMAAADRLGGPRGRVRTGCGRPSVQGKADVEEVRQLFFAPSATQLLILATSLGVKV